MKNKLLAAIITLLFFAIPIIAVCCPIILMLIGIVVGISCLWYTIYVELEREDNE